MSKTKEYSSDVH